MSSSSIPQEAPSPGPPLPSAGSPGAGSPTSAVLSVDSDSSSSVAPRFVAFAWRYHRCIPLRSPGSGPLPRGLDCFYRGARTASLRWRKRGLPGSWATLAHMPRSSTPADRLYPATSTQTIQPSANLTTSAPHPYTFEAQSRGLQAPCVRFAAGVAPGPRNTRFRLVASLCRVRTCTCWVA